MKKILTWSVMLGLALPLNKLQAQIGTWTFNNVLSGTGTADNTADAAFLSPATAGAFNGGTVYYGEGGWPAGALDPTVYLQFSVTPHSGKHISLTYLILQIRRSTTGTPSGSGPQTWSLRSSLDGYTTDVASGTLTNNSSPGVTVTLPVAFLNQTSTVAFRLYGYNMAVTSGGLNRFVYDNIAVYGYTLLPAVFGDLKAAVKNDQSVLISWTQQNTPSTSETRVERSANGIDYAPVTLIQADSSDRAYTYQYLDEQAASAGNPLYYRISVLNADGSVSYSPVVKVALTTNTGLRMSSPPVCHGCEIRLQVESDQPGDYTFSVHNLNGVPVLSRPVSVTRGSQTLNAGNRPLPGGIYVVMLRNAVRKQVLEIRVD